MVEKDLANDNNGEISVRLLSRDEVMPDTPKSLYEKITEIHSKSFKFGDPRYVLDPYTISLLFDNVGLKTKKSKRPGYFLGAFANNELVGFITAQGKDDTTVLGWILAVDEEYQNKGVAFKLSKRKKKRQKADPLSQKLWLKLNFEFIGDDCKCQH